MSEPRKTPLYDAHVRAGGKIVDFAGWSLPVQYAGGIIAEHKHTRTKASVFDVSHMGEILISGQGAFEYAARLVTNDIAKTKNGRAVYTPMCYENGTCVDDLLVYPPMPDGSMLLVVNAANTAKDFAWIRQNAPADVTVRNVSDEWGQIALQGPGAAAVMSACGMDVVNELPFFGAGLYDFCGALCVISKTGYTGERGFEIYMPPEKAERIWELLLENGAEPAGLGARDTLRFEACLPLYGHEISDEITPLEAGLGFFVKLDRPFIGRDALASAAPARKQIGLEFLGRGVPRAGYEVYANGARAGVVTSGSPSPTTGKNLALALVDAACDPDAAYTIVVRGKQEPAAVVPTPFYKSKR